ncbi:MAG: hypothetical protein OSA93_07105 [Akkermansiaceae bacterium]|nr:hypothetical protein [Akkermansiaceae bacterium]
MIGDVKIAAVFGEEKVRSLRAGITERAKVPAMIRAREYEDGDERRDEEDHEERWENSLNTAGDEIAQLEFSGINIPSR